MMARKIESIHDRKQTAMPESIDARIVRLELRLHDGFARIGEAMDHGIEVDNWEDAWIKLLREYESLQDEFVAAA